MSIRTESTLDDIGELVVVSSAVFEKGSKTPSADWQRRQLRGRHVEFGTTEKKNKRFA